MSYRMRALGLLFVGVSLGAGLTTATGVLAEKEPPAEALPLDELRTFSDIYARIKSDYVEKVSDDKLLDNAIRGMLSGLDPHSSYLDAEEYEELRIGTTGQFGGLGIEVGMENGFVKVIAPIDDTPAEQAGIQAGDLITRLDDKPVKGMSLSDAVDIMRGEPGSDIELTVVREGEDKPLRITITRDVIKVKSVKSRMLEPGFGYVRISQFQSRTTRDLYDAVESLQEKADGHLKGMVLDLRNNPGGVLQGAVGVSDAFLEKGLVVYTEGRIEDSQLRYAAKPGDVLDGAPLIVLINGGSASASEIVSGALQDHGRAVIVGSQSFGKGSVQTIQELANGGAVKLTTARYFTPSGRSIQAEGIHPDIALDPLKVAGVKSGPRPLKEADLNNHLDNPNGEGEAGGTGDQQAAEGESLAERDFTLFQALNLLKGMALLGRDSAGS